MGSGPATPTGASISRGVARDGSEPGAGIRAASARRRRGPQPCGAAVVLAAPIRQCVAPHEARSASRRSSRGDSRVDDRCGAAWSRRPLRSSSGTDAALAAFDENLPAGARNRGASRPRARGMSTAQPGSQYDRFARSPPLSSRRNARRGGGLSTDHQTAAAVRLKQRTPRPERPRARPGTWPTRGDGSARKAPAARPRRGKAAAPPTSTAPYGARRPRPHRCPCASRHGRAQVAARGAKEASRTALPDRPPPWPTAWTRICREAETVQWCAAPVRHSRASDTASYSSCARR